MIENENDFLDAIYKDLHRPKDFEISNCIKMCKSFLDDLESLTQDKKAQPSNESDKTYVRLSPL